MVVASLNAFGKSKIRNLDYLFRGYENLDIKLKKIGANITKEKEV